MTHSSNNYPYIYKDECISYKSLFPSFSKKDFDKLDEIYNQLDIDGEIKKLFSDYKINTTEDQAALHHVYRSAYGQKISNVHENFYEVAKSSISECIKLKEKLIQKGIKNIVTIGIGGSFEGPKLLLETLTKKHDRSFNHIFLTGPDTQEFTDMIVPLNKNETFFIVSSKSFSTDETMQSLGLARAWVGDDLEFKDHFMCVTSQIEKAKNFDFDETSAIQFPNEIGGRYSMWSPISLAAILELEEQFIDFLKGGSLADEKLNSNTDYKQLIKTIIFSDLWHNNFDNKHTRVLLTYSWKLRHFTDYVQQLEMESIGKGAYKNSHFNKTGQVIFGGFGSTAQHSYFQLLHQGTSSFCTDIICIDKDKKENELLFAQSQAQAGLLAFGADDNLQDHEKVNGQSPVNLISLKELNPFNLGYLIASWEHRVFLTSRMLQINPFDQYGVSAGKLFARKYLDSNGG
jgi:glucose-6-phosphate isomerase